MPTSAAHSLIQSSLVGEAIDIGPVAVFLADDDGRYLAVNHFACELLGYTREELLALRVDDVAADAQGGSDAKLRLLRKDGSLVAVSHLIAETTVARMPLLIWVAWPEPVSVARPRRLRAAPALG